MYRSLALGATVVFGLWLALPPSVQAQYGWPNIYNYRGSGTGYGYYWPNVHWPSRDYHFTYLTGPGTYNVHYPGYRVGGASYVTNSLGHVGSTFIGSHGYAGGGYSCDPGCYDTYRQVSCSYWTRYNDLPQAPYTRYGSSFEYGLNSRVIMPTLYSSPSSPEMVKASPPKKKENEKKSDISLVSAKQTHLPAEIEVRVASESVELYVDGKKTTQKGLVRLFVSPPIEVDDEFTYEFVARRREGGREQTQSKKVKFRGGEQVTVNLEPK